MTDMNAHHLSRICPWNLLFSAILSLTFLLVPVGTLASDGFTDTGPIKGSSRETEFPAAPLSNSFTGTTEAVEVQPESAAEKGGYANLELSYINFEARNDASPEAAAYGLMMVAGYRLNDYFSIEGGVNWLPLADPIILLPIPLMWAPAEKGFYSNLAGGMRLNLTRYRSSRIVPWVSLWYAGHYFISDYSVDGSGLTYGAGLEWKTKKGKRRQVSVRIHDFDGDLEVKDETGNIGYGRTEIRALEVAIKLFGG